MRSKRFRICISAGMLVLLGIFAGLITFAQEPDRAKIRQEFRNRLMDCEGVFVYVNVIAKDKSEEQSMKEQLQKDVQEQLKESKIKILTEDQLQYTPGRPRLEVYLVTFKESAPKDVYIYSFRIVHFEDAILERTQRYTEGLCWDSGLYVGREKMSSIIKTMRTHIHRYIEDYLAKNPSVN